RGRGAARRVAGVPGAGAEPGRLPILRAGPAGPRRGAGPTRPAGRGGGLAPGPGGGGAVSRPGAADRVRRVLAIVPWIVANNGVPLAEVAARFGISERELTSDLEVVWMVGLPPYTPDSLVEVVIEDGRVWIHYADFF